MRFRPSTSERAPAGSLMTMPVMVGGRYDQADHLWSDAEILGEAREDRTPGHLVAEAGQEPRHHQSKERCHLDSPRSIIHLHRESAATTLELKRFRKGPVRP